MRIPSAAALALVLGAAACTAPGPVTEASRADSCTAAFQRYDRALLAQRTVPILQDTGALRRDRTQAVGAENMLRQYDCVSFGGDVALDADLSAHARPAGATPPSDRYVHVGIVTSNGLADAVSAKLKGLGYPVVVKGADRLGRRIFVGPLGSQEAVRAAQGAAGAMGFPGVYGLDRLP
jgi:hypothetical protein